MKKNLRTMIILTALAVIFGSAATCFAQDDVIVGGYSPISAKDSGAIAAAKYAVKAQAKKQRAVIRLVSVKQAEMQIVAGRNYRICMEVTIVPKGKKAKVTKNIQAVVYQNLKQKFSLTSWEEAICLQIVLDDLLIPAKTPL